MELFDSKYFRGRGSLLIGERDAAGKAVGLQFVGDLSSVEISPDISRGETIETVSGSDGVGTSYLKGAKFTLSIVMRSIKKEHLAAAMQGVGIAKAGSTVTDETQVVKLEKMSVLEHNKVSAVVVTGPAGTPTYVLDTDYKVHADEGLIEWLTGGTVVDDDDIEVDYSYATQDHVKSAPANAEKYIVFAGKNTAAGDKQTRCEIYKVKLDPTAPGLITDDTAEMTLSGVVELDTLRAAGDQFFSWKIES